jgi:hypothetical protein
MKFVTKYLQGQWSAIRKRLRSSVGNNTHSFEKADQSMLIGLMLPLMMTIVNMTMFEVALPTIRNNFGIRADVRRPDTKATGSSLALSRAKWFQS